MKHASVAYNKNQIACKYIKPWNAYQILDNHQLRKSSFFFNHFSPGEISYYHQSKFFPFQKCHWEEYRPGKL